MDAQFIPEHKINKGLRSISLPSYTLGEELISSISHGVGAALGIAGLVLCLIRSTGHGTLSTVSAAIFGASMIILYLMSCLYHALKPNDGKRVLRIFDHCTIFLLIAGTYTPFTLVSLHGTIGWGLFSLVWGAAVLGIVLNAISVERFKVVSMICYLAMGWVIVFAFRPLSQALDIKGLYLLVGGGIAYTIGAVLYGIGSKVKYMHSVWHFFVLAGTVLHFFTVYLYVI